MRSVESGLTSFVTAPDGNCETSRVVMSATLETNLDVAASPCGDHRLTFLSSDDTIIVERK